MLCYLFLVWTPIITVGQPQVLSQEFVHLRDGVQREWSSFPLHAKDSQLIIHFKTTNVSHYQTLSLTQADVNHTWEVSLNGNPLGNLQSDEKYMRSYFSIPTGSLSRNDNTLIIRPGPGSGNASQPDDILIGNISLVDKATQDLLSESSLNIHSGIPSRLTILNDADALQPVKAIPADTLAIRCGVIYSGTGNFTFSLPAGRYKIYASRGFEYSVDSTEVVVHAGQKLSKDLSLKHEVELKNWKSIDTHVHTLEYSGHGDASMHERMLTIAGEGLDYAVITEHNRVVDIRDSVKKIKMDQWFTPIAGDELTTSVGHFNLFPASSTPTADVNNWQQVKENIAKNTEVKVVILNHARDVHNAFRPIDTIERLTGDQLPVNAMEVMNSGSQQTNPRQLYLDWLGLISRGIVLTPVGSSDSHDVSRFIVGQSRTYVYKGDLINNFLSGKVAVSFGLFTELAVQNNTVKVSVHSPSWIKPKKVILYANGKEIYSSPITAHDKTGNNVYSRMINIPEISNETILVAVAEGTDPSVPWWPIAKPYQHNSPEVNPIVVGITGPVKISR